MKILALDTATEACSVALLVDGTLISREMEFERGHAEHVLPMVDEVLAEGSVTLGSLDAIAFGRGPGGFTGVRLAASVTQGLAYGSGLPVVPVSDLAAVALRAFDLEPKCSRVVVCNDARMNEVYAACYQCRGPRDAEGGLQEGVFVTSIRTQAGTQGAGSSSRVGAQGAASVSAVGLQEGVSLTLVGEERVGPASSVALPVEWLPERPEAGSSCAPNNAIGAAGRGFRAYPELLSKLISRSDHHQPVVKLISDDILPRAHEIARLAVAEVEGGRTVTAENAMPVYLRDEVARPQPSPNDTRREPS